jgi:hypothetical protein
MRIRIRIQQLKFMRIHADPDPDPKPWLKNPPLEPGTNIQADGKNLSFRQPGFFDPVLSALADGITDGKTSTFSLQFYNLQFKFKFQRAL